MYAQRGKEKLIVAEQILCKQGFCHLCSNIRFPVLCTCRQTIFKWELIFAPRWNVGEKQKSTLIESHFCIGIALKAQAYSIATAGLWVPPAIPDTLWWAQQASRNPAGFHYTSLEMPFYSPLSQRLRELSIQHFPVSLTYTLKSDLILTRLAVRICWDLPEPGRLIPGTESKEGTDAKPSVDEQHWWAALMVWLIIESWNLEYLHRERLHNLFQCSITLTVNKFFIVLIWNFPCSSFCSLSLLVLLLTTEKSAFISLTPSSL